MSLNQTRLQEEKEKLEKQFLKGKKDEAFGFYCDLFSAKTKIEGQDGGVVTALLLKNFAEGLFDATVIVHRIKGYHAEAFVAENADDILAAKGTVYLKVNVTKMLRELIAQGKRHIAIVCTPCETAAARRIQQNLGKDCEVTVVGLFCFEAFKHDKLKAEVKSRLGVDLDCVEKAQIRNGKFTAKVDGREISCKVKDLDCASEAACKFCGDFTSELADVSVGSVGSAEGYSTVIVRSSAGEKLVRGLEAKKAVVNQTDIAKLTNFKRQRAQKSLAEVSGK